MKALEKEYQFFLDHQSELLTKYAGRYLVIVGEEVVDDYASEEEAIDLALTKFPLGSFLVQACLPGSTAYTITYHSHATLSW